MGSELRLQPAPFHTLGAYWDGRGTRFAVYAGGAERVELCLFDHAGRHEIRLGMPDCLHGVWAGYLPGVGPGQQYGYRVYGPYDPRRGLRYNPNKLLLDPYARQLVGQIRWHNGLQAYRIGSKRGDLSFDRRDSAALMPKGVVVSDRFDWGNDQPPNVPWHDTVIYELHVRGFTRLRQDLPEHDRGTFGALGHPSTVDYLRRLGVTAVELLPIHAYARDRPLIDRGLTNYWGYSTLSYFAPEPAYLSDGTIGQIKWAIRQLHAAGIEVILDVVYNHTCEGNELGPTLSWRGFDNAAYYRLLPDQPRYYINETGCGNTVNFSHPRVIQMTMDSLRYWVEEFHVDGFRFDLGVTLGREPYGFDPGCGFFDALLQDPVLSRVKLISEPWDVGPGGYQVGNHPPGFAEWNGVFRDDIRRYWRGDAGLRGSLADRLQGSAGIFDRQHRRPWASVNFITAHDGFTLHDLVSYNDKHNDANGEHNRDGANDNESCNWGAEGPTEDPGITAVREQVKRALLATLLFSHGTPMLLAGDEFGQTQQGNNNTYCQDGPLAWLDWSLPRSERGRRLLECTRRMIALRRQQPALQGLRYLHGNVEHAPGLRDVYWFDERGVELVADDWHNYAARLLALRRVETREDGRLNVTVLLLNSDGAEHEFHLPAPDIGYQLLLDTQLDTQPDTQSATPLEPHQGRARAPRRGTVQGSYRVAGHSLVLLAADLRPDEVPAMPQAEPSAHVQPQEILDLSVETPDSSTDAAESQVVQPTEKP
jgi:glycogen operon protein